jgi:hypothetical protein
MMLNNFLNYLPYQILIPFLNFLAYSLEKRLAEITIEYTTYEIEGTKSSSRVMLVVESEMDPLFSFFWFFKKLEIIV